MVPHKGNKPEEGGGAVKHLPNTLPGALRTGVGREVAKGQSRLEGAAEEVGCVLACKQ